MSFLELSFPVVHELFANIPPALDLGMTLVIVTKVMLCYSVVLIQSKLVYFPACF